MFNLLTRWLSPPIFPEDEKKTRKAKLLHAILLMSMTYIALLILANLFSQTITLSTYLLEVTAFTTSLGLYTLLKLGNVNRIGKIYLSSMFFFVVMAIALSGTIRTPIIGVLLLIIILSGFLFEVPGILVSTISGSLAILLLINAENAGRLPDPVYTVNFSHWVTHTALLVFASGLIYFAVKNTNRAIERAQLELAERKIIEQKLRKLAQAIEQSPTSIVITDLDGKIEYVNPSFSQITGYSFEEATGQNPRILKTDQTRPRIHIELWQALKEGKEWRGEFVNRKKDGSVYYENAIIRPVFDENGIATNYLAIKEDITHRKKIEAELRKSEQRFSALFNQTHDAVFILDLNGQHLAANQRAAHMLGYRLDEISHLSVNETSGEQEKSKEVFKKLMAGETIPLYERLFRKKDGTTLPVEINLELVRDADNNPLHIQSVVRDISRRKQDEEALTTANEELTRRVAEIEALQSELREQALHDPLTGLYNRRFLGDALERELTRIKREKGHLSIIAMDIDHFKQVNDRYGHQAGDETLISTANLLRKHLRGSDFICRYGGEEFLLVLPGASPEAAHKRAEEIRKACAESIIGEEQIKITISLGLATYPEHGQQGEEIIIRADIALYASKHNGRNQVTVWDETLSTEMN